MMCDVSSLMQIFLFCMKTWAHPEGAEMNVMAIFLCHVWGGNDIFLMHWCQITAHQWIWFLSMTDFSVRFTVCFVSLQPDQIWDSYLFNAQVYHASQNYHFLELFCDTLWGKAITLVSLHIHKQLWIRYLELPTPAQTCHKHATLETFWWKLKKIQVV